MKTSTTLSFVTLVLAIFMWVIPTDSIAQRRGGGSFGGSRSSGRSFSSPRSGGSSFGSRRSAPTTAPRSGSAPRTSAYSPSRPTQRSNAFGGSRVNSATDYTSRYGTPRASSRQAIPNSNGTSTNYVVNRYGGMGDGFMMGYMMSAIPWYYSMPFHPAYYYSRPTTVANPDGSVGVYPGTFQFGTLLFTLLIVGGLLFILYVVIRNRRRRANGYTAVNDGSQSSFS